MSEAYVVAIAGPIGGGKTTLARRLAGRLGDATTLHFDRYERATRQPLGDLRRWLAAGAEFDAVQVPELVLALERLKRGEEVTEPVTARRIDPARHVLFEMPLGREHAETARYIDFLIWIEVPLDVAFARKLRQLTAEALAASRSTENLREFLLWLGGYTESYLGGVRDVLRLQRERVAPSADLVVDGLGDPNEAADRAARQILDRSS